MKGKVTVLAAHQVRDAHACAQPGGPDRRVAWMAQFALSLWMAGNHERNFYDLRVPIPLAKR